ncbi:MAG: hypothetical protein L3K13_04310 [Thermoplasmata archaeon]|nr:hypothetical protein [Thermoplasmata archaeon]
MPSITVRLDDLRRRGAVLEVSIGVGMDAEKALRRAGRTVPAPRQTRAMVDIGAGRSLIRRGLGGELGLNPVGAVEIDTPSSTNLRALEYDVRFLFPKEVSVETTALEAPLPNHGLGALIGRDVLVGARLEYLGYKNEFTLEFPTNEARDS